jgi:cell division protein FtsZ
MGSAIGEGENRAIDAVQNALVSPLLNDNDIYGAKYVLLNITYGNKEVMMDEITEITDYIQDAAGATADVIWGHGYDSSLGDNLSITLIATGFSSEPLTGFEKAPERKVVSLEDEARKELTTPLDSPVYASTETTDVVAEELSVTEQLQQEPFLKTETSEVLPSYTSTNLTEEVLTSSANDISSETVVSDVVSEEVLSFSEPIQPVVESSSEEKISYDLFGSTEENTDTTDTTPVWNETLINETPETTWNNEYSEEEIEPTAELEDTTEAFTWEMTSEIKEDTVSSTEVPLASDQNVVRHMLEDDIVSPVSTEEVKRPISAEELQQRTQERVSRIQEYTAKLKKADGINEFEKEPAFVRRNINLNSNTPSSEENFSRFGLADDGTGQFSLRNNNFLHDNVD